MIRSRQTGIGFVIGLLGTAALPFLVGTTVDRVNGPRPERDARRTKAMADVMAVEEALDLFARDHARPASQEEGFATLIPAYLDRMPVDPWGNECVYAPNANNGPVISYGADGKPGGEGAARDVEGEAAFLTCGPCCNQEPSSIYAAGTPVHRRRPVEVLEALTTPTTCWHRLQHAGHCADAPPCRPRSGRLRGSDDMARAATSAAVGARIQVSARIRGWW